MLKLSMVSWTLFCATACAAADQLDPDSRLASMLSGNTLAITNRFGPSLLYFDPSGVTVSSAGDKTNAGKWRVSEGSVCATAAPTSPGKVMPEFCMAMQGRAVGDTWQSIDPTHGQISYQLLKGRQKRR